MEEYFRKEDLVIRRTLLYSFGTLAIAIGVVAVLMLGFGITGAMAGGISVALGSLSYIPAQMIARYITYRS